MFLEKKSELIFKLHFFSNRTAVFIDPKKENSTEHKKKCQNKERCKKRKVFYDKKHKNSSYRIKDPYPQRNASV